MFVYLDNSSTTKQYDQVTQVMTLAMENTFGNPSSMHSLGLDAERKVREARKIFARSVGAKEEEVYFTGGGTESDNTVLFGIADAKKRTGKKIITSKVEHPAVLEACRKLEKYGFEVAYIGVDNKCNLDMEQLKYEINRETILISIMAVNNENGTVEPIKEIAQIKNQFNKDNGTDILLHTDGVQAFGKMNLQDLGAELISVSGHKIHGPKGVGGLYVNPKVNLPAFIVGGGQEKHMRSGTENVPGIIGFGKAIEISSGNLNKRVNAMAAARKHLLDGIKAEISDLKINSIEDGGIASVLNISFLGVRGEVLLHTLEQDEIYVSTGSACSSNKKGQSHVLKEMGLSDKEIEGAIRFSFNEFNTTDEMEYVIDRLKNAVGKFRRLGSYR
ncbi:MAG: cysteine desulfurase family protein [Anaerovoracaceae bacterium]